MALHTRTTLVQRLFLKHSLILQGFIQSLLPDRSVAEDVLHEVFLVLTAKSSTFTPGTNFLAWAKAVAYRKTLQAIDARGRDALVLPREALEELAESPESDALFDDWEEKRTAMQYCLQKLSKGVRMMLRLHYFEGVGVGEVADRVGWGRSSVSVATSRARKALRECVRKRVASTEGA